MRSIKAVSTYLIAFLIGIVLLYHKYRVNDLPSWLYQDNARLPFYCILIGGLGGVTYCLRGIYLNACVRKNWDQDWAPWYYIRPIVSMIMGGISWLVLKAGLLLLESNTIQSSSDLGFMILAYIAGLNVDKFINKIEELAQTVWGIEKSRSSKDD